MSKMIRPNIKHLLDLNCLATEDITYLLDAARSYSHAIKNGEPINFNATQKIVTSLFYEPSTRTQYSFDLAARRLGVQCINPNMLILSNIKGESLLDTVHSFEAMGTDLFIVRHSDNHTPHFIAGELNSGACVINAGDGSHAHPTQALLDLFTIQEAKHDFTNLTVAIVGDIIHSRVAHSLIKAMNIMGVPDIRLVGPQSWLPADEAGQQVHLVNDLKSGLDGADVVIALRIQKERIEESSLPDMDDFFTQYGITSDSIEYAKSDAVVLHPGPINRGIEIDSSVADGPQSLILKQVENGIPVRMAVMTLLLTNAEGVI